MGLVRFPRQPLQELEIIDMIIPHTVRQTLLSKKIHWQLSRFSTRRLYSQETTFFAANV